MTPPQQQYRYPAASDPDASAWLHDPVMDQIGSRNRVLRLVDERRNAGARRGPTEDQIDVAAQLLAGWRFEAAGFGITDDDLDLVASLAAVAIDAVRAADHRQTGR